MDKNIAFVMGKKVERVIENLEKNNMNGYWIQSKEELIDMIEELVPQGSLVGCGGSITLFESGVIDHLRCGKYEFLDRYAPGLSKEDIKEVYRKSFFSDAYFASSNAITEKGELYNVDGNGNRVAAMLYGPDKVIIIVGVNKIVKDVEEAINRNKQIAAPANTKRLNLNTPCSKLGYCVDCKSEDRICCEYTLIRKQRTKGRIHVLILNESLGY